MICVFYRLLFTHRRLLLLLSLLAAQQQAGAQAPDSIAFTLTIADPLTHTAHVAMKLRAGTEDTVWVTLPQWTPGYYQVMNYANDVSDFAPANEAGKPLPWKKINDNTWAIKREKAKHLVIDYNVLASRSFVARSIIDSAHAYLTPAATFLHPRNKIATPVTLIITPAAGWHNVATGLDSVRGKQFTYTAPDFDILYDCPILCGNLEELPSFSVQGIPHRFIGYNMGSFSKVAFMQDIQRIVEAGITIIKDIPYQHYTFLAIGPGNGGIEHLTSAAVSFRGGQLNTEDGRKRMLAFLAHEYFHHYNVKRIRPTELGPFDYDKGSPTKQLWLSEGATVYYEWLILQRANLIEPHDLFGFITENMLAYETSAGRHYQSLAEASEATWSDGPFGRKGEEANKTISYYDKGPVVALMLDFAIRHYTHNKQSLDDVMRTLYRQFYKEQNRGFTEAEFRQVAEQTAGRPLPELFKYIYTTNELNYTKYFNFGGLSIDTATHVLRGVYTGVHGKQTDSLFTITKVDFDSPAWHSGLRAGAILLAVNDGKADSSTLQNLEKNGHVGGIVSMRVKQNGKEENLSFKLTLHTERTFRIAPLHNANALQRKIRQSWLGE